MTSKRGLGWILFLIVQSTPCPPEPQTKSSKSEIIIDPWKQPKGPSTDEWIKKMCCIYMWNIQFSSVAQSCPTLCNPMNCSTPGLPVHHQLPEFTQTHVHWVGDAIQPSHPLSSLSPLAPNPSQHQGLFQWVNSSHEVAKDWSFSFSIIPSKEHPELISFRIDWLALLAVQGILKSLLQHQKG